MIVTVEPRAEAAVVRGHPWIYREGIRLPRGATAKTGDVAKLVSTSGAHLGWGIFDASSPIAVRVYAGARERKLDVSTLEERLGQAIERRGSLYEEGRTTAIRVCNGEGDRIPGLVIDRYAHVAIVRIDGDALRAWVDRLTPVLARRLEPLGVTSIALRNAEKASGDETKIDRLWGGAPPEVIDVLENGMTIEVDLARGQKTGAFLDQRDNRLRVRALAAGRRRALNLFSYAGGFSVSAALAGATEVTSVDIAPRAHANAQRSFRKNGLDPRTHAFVTADAFLYLEQAAKRGERFDLVISDPPSFAPNERSKKKALGAYRRLHGLCAKVLEPNGIFCASSCSSHVSLEEFVDTLDDTALGRDDLSVVDAHGPPPDHPTLASFPEGRYLKFVVLR